MLSFILTVASSFYLLMCKLYTFVGFLVEGGGQYAKNAQKTVSNKVSVTIEKHNIR